MLFIVHAQDRSNSRDLRIRTGLPHLEFLARHRAAFRFGGPLLGDDGQPVGSLMILDLPDRAALDAHLSAEPFFASGLFQVLHVWLSDQVVPESVPGALRAEIESLRRLAHASSD